MKKKIYPAFTEVREKLIRGDSIRINEGANWNGQAESKQEYIDQLYG